MDLSEPSYVHFVERIYEAAERPERWRPLYDDLKVAIGARSIHVLGIDTRNGSLSYSDGANLPVEGELAYMHHYRLIDPRTPICDRAGEGEWLHFPRMLPQGTAAITDVGMTGPYEGVIGFKPQAVLERFLLATPRALEPAVRGGALCGAVVEVDEATGKALAVRRVRVEEGERG